MRPLGEWESPAEAGMAIDADGVIDFVDGEEEVIAETGQSIVIPKELPSPTLHQRLLLNITT